MRPYVRGTMWLIAATLIVGNVGAALAEQEGSGTRSAKCLVRIMSDPDMLPVGAEMINSLLASTPVLGEPAREILGSKADSLDDVVTVSFELLEHSQSRMGSVLTGSIAVDVHGDDARPAAEELLAAICQRLELALRSVGAIDRERFQERLAQVETELTQLDGRGGSCSSRLVGTICPGTESKTLSATWRAPGKISSCLWQAPKRAKWP